MRTKERKSPNPGKGIELFNRINPKNFFSLSDSLEPVNSKRPSNLTKELINGGK